MKCPNCKNGKIYIYQDIRYQLSVDDDGKMIISNITNKPSYNFIKILKIQSLCDICNTEYQTREEQ